MLASVLSYSGVLLSGRLPSSVVFGDSRYIDSLNGCLQAHMGVNINSPENIVFMHKNIEEAYDRQEWCLLVQADGSMQVT